ncbi:MAG TPA: hypothetical protein VGR38_02615, partial [Candidatus Polarisedimenticolia bacterium]|nr:hypothetical protein [Candidatus Polarisedimenticolia bacterium]
MVLGVVTLVVAPAARRFLEWERAGQLRAAAQHLRPMYLTGDYEGVSSKGERLSKRFPESSELKAWTILSLSPGALGGQDEAIEAARALSTAHPADPWGWFALAGALGAKDSDQALAACEKALAKMPRHPDFLWMRARTLLFSQDRAGEVP